MLKSCLTLPEGHQDPLFMLKCASNSVNRAKNTNKLAASDSMCEARHPGYQGRFFTGKRCSKAAYNIDREGVDGTI